MSHFAYGKLGRFYFVCLGICPPARLSKKDRNASEAKRVWRRNSNVTKKSCQKKFDLDWAQMWISAQTAFSSPAPKQMIVKRGPSPYCMASANSPLQSRLGPLLTIICLRAGEENAGWAEILKVRRPNYHLWVMQEKQVENVIYRQTDSVLATDIWCHHKKKFCVCSKLNHPQNG